MQDQMNWEPVVPHTDTRWEILKVTGVDTSGLGTVMYSALKKVWVASACIGKHPAALDYCFDTKEAAKAWVEERLNKVN